VIYLLDTTSVSAWMNEHPALAVRLAALSSSDSTIICPIVRGEIIFGLMRLPPGKRRQRLEARAMAALAKFGCQPVPESAGDHYARIRAQQERKGLALSANDLWIAATAAGLDARLVSTDADFRRIDGFAVEDWTG
jgi:predicted nucleic acid-binding protein